jgi:hypothetical protein
MTATEPQTVLIGTFADRARAERFVEALRRAGFRDEQIGVATPGGEAPGSEAGDAALAGALTGGTMGALAGLTLAAAGLLPGVGAVLAGGLLAGSLGGAAVGATAGGLLAGLIALGLPEEQARHYEGQLKAGRTLVAVKAPARAAEALAILRRCDAEEGPAGP